MSQDGNANQAIDSALKYLKLEDINGALSVLESASRLSAPAVRDFDHIRGVVLSKLARFDEAAAALESEVARYPDNTGARELLKFIKNEFLTGKAISALTGAVEQVSQVAGNDLSQMANQAMGELNRGNGVGALRLAESIAKVAPNCGGVNFLRVLCLNAVGRHEEALVAAEKELLINPSHAAARAQFEQLSIALKRKVHPALNPEQRSYHSKLDQETLKSIQNATHNYTYRGVSMIKNPFDFAIYPLLFWDVKPKTVIEIGSKCGGSALWFGDLMNNYGIDGHIYSIDIVKVDEVSHPRVTFLEGDGRNLAATLSADWIASLPRPLLIIEDADHSYETSSAVLKFFNPFIEAEEFIVIEDGIISDLENDGAANSGPHRALKEFISHNPGAYESCSKYSDFFGYNYTWCTNGFLKKRKFAPNVQISKKAISEFLTDDPVPQGIESQMSPNERFQLYTAVRTLLPCTEKILRYIEIGAHAGASFKLEHIAAQHDGRRIQPIAIEPGGLPSFYEVVSQIGATHIRAYSHEALSEVKRICSDGVRPEFIMIDGDHSYEGVKQDILDYYEVLAPGGIMIFHDFLPALTSENREAIFFHHGGREPGIRQACMEVIEGKFGAIPVELPLLYPNDPTQTQPHLPVIPGVYSTIRIYRKPR